MDSESEFLIRGTGGSVFLSGRLACQMTLPPVVRQLRKDALVAIAALATEYQGLVKDAAIDKDDPLSSSRQKLQLDVHTMAIDQNARKLLRIIRSIKELKVSDDFFQDQRGEFEQDCNARSDVVSSCMAESYQRLSQLADDGFHVLQTASKLLR
jgi:hypothetical protein